jgi:hypothetical protein
MIPHLRSRQGDRRQRCRGQSRKVAIAYSDECVRKEGMRSYERLLKDIKPSRKRQEVEGVIWRKHSWGVYSVYSARNQLSSPTPLHSPPLPHDVNCRGRIILGWAVLGRTAHAGYDGGVLVHEETTDRLFGSSLRGVVGCAPVQSHAMSD